MGVPSPRRACKERGQGCLGLLDFAPTIISYLILCCQIVASGKMKQALCPPHPPTVAQSALASLFFPLTVGLCLHASLLCSSSSAPAVPVIISMDMAWLNPLISLGRFIILLHILCFCLFQQIIEFGSFFSPLKFNRPFSWDNS